MTEPPRRSGQHMKTKRRAKALADARERERLGLPVPDSLAGRLNGRRKTS